MATEFVTVLCTVPDQKTALTIARTLVESRLAACCNIVPGLRSIYFWEGQVQDDQELLLIIKSKKKAFPELEEKIKSLHPYQVPEILAISVDSGNSEYLNWLDENVKGPIEH